MRLAAKLLSRDRTAARVFASRLPAGCASVLSAALLLAATTVFAATLYHVAQRNRAFSMDQITLARGDSIAFSDEDEFLHQIYVDSRQMDFDSAEQHPGETITVSFPHAGTFPVRCHIHPKMLLTVHVN
jgi:plastocyanin